MKPDIIQLNQVFSINTATSSVNFRLGKGEIPVVELSSAASSAIISLQGAHLLSWKPAGKENLLWLSEDAIFREGKSLRGGIPVCWPWFGAHTSHSEYPAHGFARTVYWQVVDAEVINQESIAITFKLFTRELDDVYQQMWSADTQCEYRVTISDTLTLELSTTNFSDKDITISQALHTYFKVNDLRKTRVSGLDNKSYLDKPDNFRRKTQSGDIRFSEEVDRIFLDTADDVIIDDEVREIIIHKAGSRSTVVWNPWKEVAASMGDLGEDGYLKMVCVESANAADDAVVIPAGERHTLRVEYEIP